jgi:hypothetical protein
VAEAIDGFGLGRGMTDRSRQIALGKRVAKLRDRVIGEFQVVRAGDRHHSAAWRLVPIKPGRRDDRGPGEPGCDATARHGHALTLRPRLVGASGNVSPLRHAGGNARQPRPEPMPLPDRRRFPLPTMLMVAHAPRG